MRRKPSTAWPRANELAVAISVFVIGCASGTTSVTEPATVVITSPDKTTGLTIAPHESVPLTVEALNAAGNEVTGAGPFVFRSRDTTIASVSDVGVVRARQLGQTEVVVSLQDGSRILSDSIHVIVSGPVGGPDMFAIVAQLYDSRTTR